MPGNLIHYRESHILELVNECKNTVMESTLLRLLHERFAYPSLSKSNLHKLHFSLFHRLYRMKEDSRYYSYFILINTMRIVIKKLPPETVCSYYDMGKNSFCGIDLMDGKCPVHGKDGNALVHDCLSIFYRDPENIAFFHDEQFLRKMDVLLYCGINYKRVKSALAFFKQPSLNSEGIKEKYRLLARKRHPDLGGNAELMQELNYFYGIVKPLID